MTWMADLDCARYNGIHMTKGDKRKNEKRRNAKENKYIL
jgi:hypothetical protein